MSAIYTLVVSAVSVLLVSVSLPGGVVQLTQTAFPLVPGLVEVFPGASENLIVGLTLIAQWTAANGRRNADTHIKAEPPQLNV